MGREHELDELSAGLEDARTGKGRLVLVSGEPGIGKTRLVDEFSVRVRERNVRLLWGRCWEAGGAPPYWPWVQLLRSYVRSQDPEVVRSQIGTGAADLAQILQEVRELFPDVAPPAAADPDSARFQLFDSTTSFVLKAAESEPLVLVLEDLHAADTPSLLFLRFLAAQLARSSFSCWRRIGTSSSHRNTRSPEPSASCPGSPRHAWFSWVESPKRMSVGSSRP